MLIKHLYTLIDYTRKHTECKGQQRVALNCPLCSVNTILKAQGFLPLAYSIVKSPRKLSLSHLLIALLRQLTI